MAYPIRNCPIGTGLDVLHYGGFIPDQLDGVNDVRVTFEDKSAEVAFDSDQTSDEQMKEALAKANYTAEK